jgi:spermidine/putrescine transport system permease protein
MGTAAAVGINKLRSRWYRAAMDSVTNIPMMNPDIITGISLMLMFVFVGRIFGASTSLNFWTMLIAHITFCLPYVILQVLPKLQQMDPALPEAAMDLGCTPIRAFLKVELPEITPGIVTGLIMAFTMSLDDFVISYFTSGNGFQTLPISIYNMTKKTVTPKMYALATIIFFVILTLLLINNVVDTDDGRKLRKLRKSRKSAKLTAMTMATFKKITSNKPVLIGSGVVVIAAIAVLIGINSNKPLVLNVYNWGEYISDGSEDSFDTVKEFEKWYEAEYGQKVHVNYTTFASNEDMYSKLSSGAVSYDIVIPSDYMTPYAGRGYASAAQLRQHSQLSVTSARIPRAVLRQKQRVHRSLHHGIVGVIYDANVVDEEDAEGWDLM